MPRPDPIPPRIVAGIDRHRAALRDLVAEVRDHQSGCPNGHQGCIGHRVLWHLQHADRRVLENAFATALFELALLPAQPSTTDGIDLTTTGEDVHSND